MMVSDFNELRAEIFYDSGETKTVKSISVRVYKEFFRNMLFSMMSENRVFFMINNFIV